MIDVLFRPEVMILIAAGSVVGYLFGILPGLDGLIALALFAPLGLYLKADVAFYFYAAMLGAATFAGSVPAILFSIPGTPFNLVTTFDGFPMSRQGRAMEALAISAVASALGAFISVVFLVLALPVGKQIVLLFGPAERCWLVLCPLLLVPFLGGADWLKGLVSGALGLVLCFIGRSVVTGEFRYTFGTTYLANGLGIIPFLAIGVFAVSVILRMMSTAQQPIATGSVKINYRQMWTGMFYVLRQPLALIRGSFIGVIVGAIPGIGGVTASFLSYIAAKGSSKTPERFGKGIPSGVLAPECANNAVQGGGALTSLLLGIPGTAEWAIVLGIMVMYGIMPGPDLVTEHPEVVLGVIWGIVASNAISSGIGLLVGVPVARLTGIKPLYIVPVILVTCMLGAYLMTNNIWDCMIALVGALLGYFLRKLNYELLPFVLGFILGPYFEKNFYLAFQVGLGEFSAFFASPTSIILVIFCVAVLVIGPRLQRRLAGVGTVVSVSRQTRFTTSELLPNLLFPLVILAIGVYVFASSFGYKFISAAFAGFVGGILVALSTALLVRELGRGLVELTTRPERVPTPATQRTPPLIIPLAWSVGLFMGLLLIGFVLAIPIWVFVYLLWHRASRVFTVVTPVVLWAIIKFVVESALGTLFFEGILFGGRLPHLW